MLLHANTTVWPNDGIGFSRAVHVVLLFDF